MSDATMGARLSEHPGKFFAGGWLWYVGGLLLLAAVFGGINGVREVLTGEARIIEVISATFFSGLFGVLLLIVPVLRWRQRVECFEGGLVWNRLYGAKTIRKDELKGVQLIFHRGRYGNYDEVELTTTSGCTSIKGIANAEQLANHVRAWLSGPPAGAGGPPAGGGGWTPPQQPSPPGGGWTPPAQGGQGGGWTPPGG